MMLFMPEHSLFEFGKGSVCAAVFGRQVGPFFIEVFVASSPPGTVGYGEHVGIQVVFPYHVFFRLYQAVVPDGQDDTCHIIATFGIPVDGTVV